MAEKKWDEVDPKLKKLAEAKPIVVIANAAPHYAVFSPDAAQRVPNS